MDVFHFLKALMGLLILHLRNEKRHKKADERKIKKMMKLSSPIFNFCTLNTMLQFDPDSWVWYYSSALRYILSTPKVKGLGPAPSVLIKYKVKTCHHLSINRTNECQNFKISPHSYSWCYTFTGKVIVHLQCVKGCKKMVWSLDCLFWNVTLLPESCVQVLFETSWGLYAALLTNTFITRSRSNLWSNI